MFFYLRVVCVDMMNEKIIIKEDINFLEYPNWVVSKRDYKNHLIIKKDTGFYELKSTEGLPVRFDKVVLYYLLHKLSIDSDLNSVEITTTRYDIAKNVFSQEKNFSKAKYDRIMLALKKWKALVIKFEGIFYEGDNFTVKYFAVIDYVSLDKKTNKLSIKFNDLYIKQIKETKYYKLINFIEYKKMTRPVSIRLYEILIKNFIYENTWAIYIDTLGEKLTLGKRAFPSQILVALMPAINEINEHSQLRIEFCYDKESDICIFKKLSFKPLY